VRRLALRLQQTCAGFLEHTDAQVGRLLEHLSSCGLEYDTLVMLTSDNGASAEGGPTGALNFRKQSVYETEGPDVGLAAMEKIDTEFAFNHYPTV
jgi:arylsulfatase A-like enzyme